MTAAGEHQPEKKRNVVVLVALLSMALNTVAIVLWARTGYKPVIGLLILAVNALAAGYQLRQHRPQAAAGVVIGLIGGPVVCFALAIGVCFAFGC